MRCLSQLNKALELTSFAKLLGDIELLRPPSPFLLLVKSEFTVKFLQALKKACFSELNKLSNGKGGSGSGTITPNKRNLSTDSLGENESQLSTSSYNDTPTPNNSTSLNGNNNVNANSFLMSVFPALGALPPREQADALAVLSLSSFSSFYSLYNSWSQYLQSMHLGNPSKYGSNNLAANASPNRNSQSDSDIPMPTKISILFMSFVSNSDYMLIASPDALTSELARALQENISTSFRRFSESAAELVKLGVSKDVLLGEIDKQVNLWGRKEGVDRSKSTFPFLSFLFPFRFLSFFFFAFFSDDSL